MNFYSESTWFILELLNDNSHYLVVFVALAPSKQNIGQTHAIFIVVSFITVSLTTFRILRQEAKFIKTNENEKLLCLSRQKTCCLFKMRRGILFEKFVDSDTASLNIRVNEDQWCKCLFGSNWRSFRRVKFRIIQMFEVRKISKIWKILKTNFQGGGRKKS